MGHSAASVLVQLEPSNPRTLGSFPSVPHLAHVEIEPLLALTPAALEMGDAQGCGPTGRAATGGGALAADDEPAPAAAALHANGDVDIAVVRDRDRRRRRGARPCAIGGALLQKAQAER